MRKWYNYYYITNLQGDVMKVIDSAGTVKAEYTYDPWGKPLKATGTLASVNPLRYRGYYYDAETGFYYCKGRYYDPEIGRFINADNAENIGINGDFASTNLFAYCGNDPVNRVDDGGEFWHIVAGAVGGAVVGGLAKLVSNLVTGNNWSDGLGTAILTGAASGALAATGASLIGSIAGNAFIAMAGNATDQVIKNHGFDNFKVEDMFIDGVIGGFAGAVGGPGASKGNAKSAMSLGKQLSRRISNTGEIGLAISYYNKNMMTEGGKSIYKELSKSIRRAGLATFSAITGKAFIVPVR